MEYRICIFTYVVRLTVLEVKLLNRPYLHVYMYKPIQLSVMQDFFVFVCFVFYHAYVDGLFRYYLICSFKMEKTDSE